jgi:hypothetical protein
MQQDMEKIKEFVHNEDNIPLDKTDLLEICLSPIS